jgi:hypothetical protein
MLSLGGLTAGKENRDSEESFSIDGERKSL